MGAIRRFFESPPIGYLSWLYGGTTDGINLLDKVTTDPLDPVQVVRKVLELNGTSDKLVVNNSSGLGNFGSSDFTLEFTADLTDTSTEKAIVSKWTGSGNQRSWFTMVDAMGRLSLFTSTDGSTTKTAYIDKASVPQRITSVVIAKSGASATASFDGGAPIAFSGDVVSSIYTSTSSIYISTINAGIAYYFSGKIARAKVAGIFEYAFEESAGTTIYDISGNGNDGTLTGGTWTMAQGFPSYQALNGFRLDGSVYIPALSDGSAAADGNPITNPGGLLHNGGSYELVHTDASQNTDPFWSDGAGTLLNKSYADFVAQIAARTDADEWRFTQTADDLIEEGTFYSQALTGLALSHLKVYHERYE